MKTKSRFDFYFLLKKFVLQQSKIKIIHYFILECFRKSGIFENFVKSNFS